MPRRVQVQVVEIPDHVVSRLQLPSAPFCKIPWRGNCLPQLLPLSHWSLPRGLSQSHPRHSPSCQRRMRTFQGCSAGKMTPLLQIGCDGKRVLFRLSLLASIFSSCQHLDTLEAVLSENTKCGRHLEVDHFLDVHLDLSFSNKQRFIFDHKPKMHKLKT